MFRSTKIKIAVLEYRNACLERDVRMLKDRVAIKEAEAAAMAGVVMQREAHIKILEGRADAD